MQYSVKKCCFLLNKDSSQARDVLVVLTTMTYTAVGEVAELLHSLTEICEAVEVSVGIVEEVGNLVEP